MKKLTTLLLAFVMVFSLAACGAEKKTEEAKGDEGKTTEQGTEKEGENKDGEKKEAIKVSLVTDTGGIDDKSFNQSAWEGIQRFYVDNGLDAEGNSDYLQSSAEADYVPNLSTFADDKKDLIVAPGFFFANAMAEVAGNYSDQKFLLIDAVLEEPKDNVVSATFAENEGSFLVGVVSALKAQEAGKTKVGFIGGKDFPVIQNFEAGFESGVAAVDPNMEVLVEYADTFEDSAKEQTIASKMYDKGCYVIFHASGGAGKGLFKEAMDRVKNGEDVWACGVDKDQYLDGIYDEKEQKSIILTSMMKKVDVAAQDVSQAVLDGKFKGGQTLLFNLENKGVGLPEINPNLKDEWVEKADEFAKKIVSGEIKVSSTPKRLEK